jgi:hypothetical protein
VIQEQTNEENRSVFAEAETVREQRLNSIFTAREKVREIRLDIEDRRFGRKKFHPKSAVGIYRGTIETYLQEIEPLFLANSKGNKLWNNEEFGTVVVEPPVSKSGKIRVVETDSTTGQLVEPANIREKVTPVEYSLTGLSSLFSYGNPLKYTFEFRYNAPGEKEKRKSATGKGYVDKRTLDSMFRAANRYLREIGIGLELEEDKGPAEI